MQGISAQRLAASMESSLIKIMASRFMRNAVLNALRHQWNPHTEVCNRGVRAGTVLNALRHQWNPHPGDTSLPLDAAKQCSTPCGINGILTLLVQRQHVEMGHYVLNALRHQWNPHAH